MILTNEQKQAFKNLLAHYISGLGDDSQIDKAYQFTGLFDRNLIDEIMLKIEKI